MKTLSDYLVMIEEWIERGTAVVDLYSDHGWKDSISVVAKIDTGADSTSVHHTLCEALGWDIVGARKVKNANGGKRRSVFVGTIGIEDDLFEDVLINGADRSNLNYPVIIGRNLLKELISMKKE